MPVPPPKSEDSDGSDVEVWEDAIVFESFEVTPPASAVLSTSGKLLCSYPGPAIQIPMDTWEDPKFRHELSSFLSQMNVDVLDSAPDEDGSTTTQERDSVDPRHIVHLLTGILRGVGKPASVSRICKRIGDDVLGKDAKNPWRRSAAWHVIRVALQTTLQRSGQVPTHTRYKSFIAFLHAYIISRAVEEDLDSNLLFTMRAKLARRVHKLSVRSVVPEYLLEYVTDIGGQVEEVLQSRWTRIQASQARAPPWKPAQLNLLADCRLKLPNSKVYISEALQDLHRRGPAPMFHPKEPSRLRVINDFHQLDKGALKSAFKADPPVALADFEHLVQKNLETWVAANLMDADASKVLLTCIKQYSTAAQKQYAQNPEDQSLKILALFSLWVALDKVAVVQCPMLRDYSPEVSETLLLPLLLRGSESHKALISIQQYLRGRHGAALYRGSIFSDTLSTTSFPVRYFDASQEHQRLKVEIEEEASDERLKLEDELDDLNHKHKSRMRRAEKMEHEHTTTYYTQRRKQVEYVDRSKCEKCKLLNTASAMRISVHEWPLPKKVLAAKRAVFELRCPKVFARWRTATYLLLHDNCTPPDKRAPRSKPSTDLAGYAGLTKWMKFDSLTSITLAAGSKTSRGEQREIPAKFESICLENNLGWRMYDQGRECWAAEPFTHANITRFGTLVIKDAVYGSLQYAVKGTTHTLNAVIADQADCPRDLSLHEYTAFAGLRSGGRIQWLNIARELANRTLTFRREAVHVLLTQAAWQVGSITDTGVMDWHLELASEEFANVLLDEMQSLLDAVSANWKEGVSVRTIILLSSRLLASIREPEVVVRACALMREARHLTFEWMHTLITKLQDCGEKYIQDFQTRVCEMAATCRSTYDVDSIHLRHLLNTPDDVAVLLECAIVIYDNSPANQSKISPDFKKVLDRDRRLSHSLELPVLALLRTNQRGLDTAITAIWSSYRPGDVWNQLGEDNARWMESETFAAEGQESQRVHLNVLEGRLLINGKPLGRLPPGIVHHDIYARVFGQVDSH